MNFLQTIVLSSHIFLANTIDIAFPMKKEKNKFAFLCALIVNLNEVIFLTNIAHKKKRGKLHRNLHYL